jgi:hypothetical protein
MSINKNRLSAVFIKPSEVLQNTSNFAGPQKNSLIVAKDLARYDAIMKGQLITQNNIDAYIKFKEDNPNTLCFYYVHGDSTVPTSLPVERYDYLDYTYINNEHPEWFVLQNNNPASGNPAVTSNRIRWDTNSTSIYYNRFYLNVCNTGFQEWAANQILRSVKSNVATQNSWDDPLVIVNNFSFDGAIIDDVHIGYHGTTGLTPLYPTWSYANQQDVWDSGYIEFLSVIKKKLNKNGLLFGANHTLEYKLVNDTETLWEDFVDSVDIVVTENMFVTRTRMFKGYFNSTLIQSCLQRDDEITNKDKITWWIFNPQQDVDFKYFYYNYLMVKSNNNLFYSYKDGITSKEVPWRTEYTYNIGEPISDRYSISEILCREYEKSYVIFNTSVLQQGFLAHGWTHNISNIRSQELNYTYTIPAGSGAIILKSYAIHE